MHLRAFVQARKCMRSFRHINATIVSKNCLFIPLSSRVFNVGYKVHITHVTTWTLTFWRKIIWRNVVRLCTKILTYLFIFWKIINESYHLLLRKADHLHYLDIFSYDTVMTFYWTFDILWKTFTIFHRFVLSENNLNTT